MAKKKMNLILAALAWGCGAVGCSAATPPAEDAVVLEQQLAALASRRGDAYFADSDKIAASRSGIVDLLASVAKNEKATPVVRLEAEILRARLQDREEFGKASAFARLLLATGKAEKGSEQGERDKAWQDKQQEETEKLAARNRWQETVRNMLKAAKVGDIVAIKTLDGSGFEARKVADNEYWVRASGDKRTWEQWRKDIPEDEFGVNVYSVERFLDLYSNVEVRVGAGLSAGPFGYASEGRGRDRYPIPKDVSALKSKVGRLAMIELIISSRPEKGWEDGNRDERAKVSVADQVAILKVLASGDNLDGQLVAVFNGKIEEQAASQKPIFYHYWAGSNYSVLGYLARHKAKGSTSSLIKLLGAETKGGGSTSDLRPRAAETLGAIGGQEAEAFLLNASRSDAALVRMDMLGALAQLSTGPSRTRLAEMAKSEPDETIREEAKAVLAKLSGGKE